VIFLERRVLGVSQPLTVTHGGCRTIIGNPDGTFLWLQSYIDEYSLGTWMERSKNAHINPMSVEELRRRLKLLHALEEDAEYWDDKADDIYDEVILEGDVLRCSPLVHCQNNVQDPINPAHLACSSFSLPCPALRREGQCAQGASECSVLSAVGSLVLERWTGVSCYVLYVAATCC
jgi:hypothetical protein